MSAVGRADRPALTTLSRPFLPRFPPFFRRSFALSGFLAPRRRKWAKNGAKWAKNGQDRRLVSSALAALPTALWPVGAARAGSAPTARAASRRPSPRRARRWRARRCRSRATGAARSSPPSVRARFAAAFAGPFWRRSGFAAAAAAPASAFAFAPARVSLVPLPASAAAPSPSSSTCNSSYSCSSSLNLELLLGRRRGADVHPRHAVRPAAGGAAGRGIQRPKLPLRPLRRVREYTAGGCPVRWPPKLHCSLTLFRPYLAKFSPVFSRFLRAFTVSTRRSQRAPSRNPGPEKPCVRQG